MYKTQRDRFFKVFILFCIVLVLAAFLVPYSISIALYGGGATSLAIIVSGILLLSIIFLLWPVLAIRYEFFDEYLLIRGGPFQSKIRYEDITKVQAKYFSVADTLAGYRVMCARDGVEINYKTGLMGHVRISPERKEQFLAELKMHAPHAHHC